VKYEIGNDVESVDVILSLSILHLVENPTQKERKNDQSRLNLYEVVESLV
jgi:hypothetical protein